MTPRTIRKRIAAMANRLEDEKARLGAMFPRTLEDAFGGDGDDISELARNLATCIAFIDGVGALSDEALRRESADGEKAP